MGVATFVRFQSSNADAAGRFVGIFGLINMLAKQGRLSAEQEAFRRINNAWYDAAYPDPSTTDPLVYDAEAHPGAQAWFKSTASQLVDRAEGYLQILAAHGVGYERLEAMAAPGRVIYEDDFQVVVVPA